MRKNINNDISLIKSDQIDKIKRDCRNDKHQKLKDLYYKLTADLSKDLDNVDIEHGGIGMF